jgi:hypothetical protein
MVGSGKVRWGKVRCGLVRSGGARFGMVNLIYFLKPYRLTYMVRIR